MTFSQALQQHVFNVRSQFPPVDLTNRGLLISNFLFLYHVMKASENLLEVAAKESVGDELHAYFVEHLEEERSHDEWLAKDLLSAGVDVRISVVPRIAVEMAGSMYYLIYHVDPVAHLGYMAALEGMPMPLEVVELLEKIHGKKLLRTLRYHAENDIDHSSQLNKVLDALPDSRKSIVWHTAAATATYIGAATLQFTPSVEDHINTEHAEAA
jgi:hypothetical protein